MTVWGAHRVVTRLTVLLLAAAIGAGACSSDDRPPPTSATVPVTASSVATTTSVPETAIDRPSLAEVLRSVEVSVRTVQVDGDVVMAIEVREPTLETIHDVTEADAPAWCSGVTGAGVGDQFVVRVAPPAVDVSIGGLQRFELRSTLPVAHDAPPAEARLELVVDGSTLVADDVVVDLGPGALSGTFRGTASPPPGATVEIEGAFRCS